MPAVTPPFNKLILDAGAPAIVKPAGYLYSRTDQAGLYASVVGPSLPSVKQFANAQADTVTFGNAVTAGNLLIAFWGNGGGIAPANGWQTLDSNGSGISAQSVYRYALSSDGATPPPIVSSGGPGQPGIEMVEIEGLTGLGFSHDVIAHTMDADASTFNTSAINATTADQLLLYCGMGFGWTANSPYPSGLTGIEQWSNQSYGGMTLASLNTVGAGNVGGNTCTRESGSLGNNFAAQIILAGQAQSWTLIGP